MMATLLSGCSPTDENAKPVFGSSGLPANCRAYVQIAIDSFKAHEYTAEQSMEGLERNCGANGQLWGYRP
ncbi:MAG: kynureninase [Desulfurellales bacterium]|nr:MAG: kynureninase [Desulfurellales bacterium]